MRTRRTQLRAYFLFCKAYDLPAFQVTEQVYWLYLTFLVDSFSSYTCNSVNNYLSCPRQVNLYLRADVTFFASPQIHFFKQAAKRVLAKPVAITVNILLAIFKLLDFSLSLHVCMWAIFLVAFFSLLRKSNLVPTTLADVTSDSATHLKIGDVSFHQDHCTLHVHKTKTIQFRQRALEIALPLIPHSVLCPVSALKRHLCYVIQDTEAPLFTIHTSTALKPVTGHHFAKFLQS